MAYEKSFGRIATTSRWAGGMNLKRLLEQWGPQFRNVELVSLQVGVWQVRSEQGVFVLKRRSNRSRVWAEYDLMNWLIENNQPVSPLMYTSKEVPWAEYEGAFYVLYPYHEGTPGNKLGSYDQNFALSGGGALASLHRDLANYQNTQEFPNFDLFQEVATFAWPNVQAYLSPAFRNRVQDIEQGISRNLLNPYESLPRQLIHRDFHPGNLIFQDGKVVGVLDFDRVRLGIRIFDLCYLSTAVLAQDFSDPQGRNNWPLFVQDLVKGYSDVQPLTHTEAISFLYIIYLIQLLFIAYQLDAGNTELADLNTAMLLWINEQHEFLETLIVKTFKGQGDD